MRSAGRAPSGPGPRNRDDHLPAAGTACRRQIAAVPGRVSTRVRELVTYADDALQVRIAPSS
jgi:hypothetical protein